MRTKSQRILRTPAWPARAQQVLPRLPEPQILRSPQSTPEARPYSRPLGGPRQGPLRPSGPGSVGAGSVFRRSRYDPGRAPAVGAHSGREASSGRRLADRLPFVLDP